MAEVYGTLQYPSDQVTLEAGDTFAVSAAFERTAGIVGVGDVANNDGEEGTVYEVNNSTEARTLFGTDSELQEQVDLAFLNGAATVFAVAVPTQSNTESLSTTSSAVLTESPVLDPNLHDTSVEVTDTSESATVDVSIEYTSPPSSPATTNTANLNPVTGEIEFDESSSYEVSYEFASYQTAISDMIAESPRSLAVCTENTEVANTLLTELETVDDNFNFITGYVGASPEIDADAYSDAFDSRRLVVSHASRGYFDAAATTMGRTVGALAGKQAGKELGDSTTYESVGGFASLHQPVSKSDYSTLIDSQVLPLVEDGEIFIVKDMTTSTEPKFERVYASEIADEATENTHTVAQSFVGEPNIQEVRTALADSLNLTYADLLDNDLLNDYTIAVSEGADDFTVDVNIGADIVSIIDNVDVEITIGDVITNETAT
jgi:hypothetical protein